MNNNSSLFPESLPGDESFDFNNDKELDDFESLVRDSEISTYWEERDNAGKTNYLDEDDEEYEDDIDYVDEDGNEDEYNEDCESDKENFETDTIYSEKTESEQSEKQIDEQFQQSMHYFRPRIELVHDDSEKHSYNHLFNPKNNESESTEEQEQNDSPINFENGMPSAEEINETATYIVDTLFDTFYKLLG